MKIRLLIELEIEGATADDVYDVAEHALDAGAVQEVFEESDRDGPTLKVTAASVSTLETDLRHILWPGGDAEVEHGSDTLANLANRLDYLRPIPASGRTSGGLPRAPKDRPRPSGE